MTATRVRSGAISLRRPSHLPPIENSYIEKPVTFPPGLARLATRPCVTGSEICTNTTGMVLVACLIAVRFVVEDARMTMNSRRRRQILICPSRRHLQVGFNQLSGTLAARNTWLVRIFLLTLENGFTYSQTISPDGVTSKKRPFAPSQIRVFPLGWRCALLIKWLKNVQMGRPLFSALYSYTMAMVSGLISRTRELGRAKARCGFALGGMPPLSNTSTLPVPGTPTGSICTLCCPMVMFAFHTIFFDSRSTTTMVLRLR